MAAITRQHLNALLKCPVPAPDNVRLVMRDAIDHDTFIARRITVEAGETTLPGTLLLPKDRDRPTPAILYCHAHGNRYDIGAVELLEGRPALQEPPYGPALAQRGCTVLCVDMPGFGARQAEGTEGALAKAALWRGTTLFGRMLAELSAALSTLCTLDTVDETRIATLGISMGATHAYWLAALDERIAACAHMCAFANIGPLIGTDAHDLHGIYMTVPGLLDHGDMADVAALVAPRPQLVASGANDPLTPPNALNPALETLRQAYGQRGTSDRLTVLTSPDTGHEETPEMRRAALEFLDRELRG